MSKKVDPNSPEAKRQLAKILAGLFVITAAAGILLGWKINTAEKAFAERHGDKPAVVKATNDPAQNPSAPKK